MVFKTFFSVGEKCANAFWMLFTADYSLNIFCPFSFTEFQSVRHLNFGEMLNRGLKMAKGL